MRVATYYNNRDIRVEERPRPEIGRGEILVRVEACGICGSDVMEWYRIHKAPLILGHEAAGVVEETGPGVQGFKKGDRVALAHHLPCGKCHYCLSGHETVCETLRKTSFDPGGFCEFLRLSELHVRQGVFLLPDPVSFEMGTFVEPLACVARGQRIAGTAPGKCVLVIGSGIAGLLHVHLAHVRGARPVIATDINAYRLDAAKRFGADACVDAKELTPDAVRRINGGRLADVVVVSTGAPAAIQQAIQAVERGGTVLFFAPVSGREPTAFPFNQLFWRSEITLTSSYAATPAEYREALAMIAGGKVDLVGMITHRFPLAGTQEGFRLVEEGRESIKVIIQPYV